MEKQPKEWSVRGDPTEGALVVAAAKAGLTDQAIEEAYSRLAEIAFDSDRRRMTVICQNREEKYSVYSKGAPDTILRLCTKVYDRGKIKLMTERMRKKILVFNEKMK